MRNLFLKTNGRHLSAVCSLWTLALIIFLAVPATALDLFTLWSQTEIPLSIKQGDYVDYRHQVMAGGRREEGITRIACLATPTDNNDGTYLLELLPLDEQSDGSLLPAAGQGAQVRLSAKIMDRQGPLLSAVVSVRLWQDAQVRDVTAEELRQDPMISTSFQSDFVPDEISSQQKTTRVVQGRQFSCRQWVMASADTQSAIMPAGKMLQISSREIAAAVNEEIPFLGLAYASERVKAVSSLDPPNRKIPVPPARIRVEVMELVGFGHNAITQLTAGN